MHAAPRKAGELREREASAYNAIHSRRGCRQQDWHTDYNPADVRRKRRKPRSAIMCLETGSRLWIAVDGVAVEVKLEVGDILLFDGDVVHAGAAYAWANTRLHVYLDVLGVRHVLNETYLVEDE